MKIVDVVKTKNPDIETETVFKLDSHEAKLFIELLRRRIQSGEASPDELEAMAAQIQELKETPRKVEIPTTTEVVGGLMAITESFGEDMSQLATANYMLEAYASRVAERRTIQELATLAIGKFAECTL